MRSCSLLNAPSGPNSQLSPNDLAASKTPSRTPTRLPSKKPPPSPSENSCGTAIPRRALGFSSAAIKKAGASAGQRCLEVGFYFLPSVHCSLIALLRGFFLHGRDVVDKSVGSAIKRTLQSFKASTGNII